MKIEQKKEQIARNIKFYNPIHTLFIILNVLLALAGFSGFIYGLRHYKLIDNASFIGGDTVTVSLFVLGFGALGLYASFTCNEQMLYSYGFMIVLSAILRLVSALIYFINTSSIILYSLIFFILEVIFLLLTIAEIRYMAGVNQAF